MSQQQVLEQQLLLSVRTLQLLRRLPRLLESLPPPAGMSAAAFNAEMSELQQTLGGGGGGAGAASMAAAGAAGVGTAGTGAAGYDRFVWSASV